MATPIMMLGSIAIQPIFPCNIAVRSGTMDTTGIHCNQQKTHAMGTGRLLFSLGEMGSLP